MFTQPGDAPRRHPTTPSWTFNRTEDFRRQRTDLPHPDRRSKDPRFSLFARPPGTVGHAPGGYRAQESHQEAVEGDRGHKVWGRRKGDSNLLSTEDNRRTLSPTQIFPGNKTVHRHRRLGVRGDAIGKIFYLVENRRPHFFPQVDDTVP